MVNTKSMVMLEFTPASRADIPAVAALLASAGLPLEGFSEHIDHAVLARDGDRITGSAVLELYGSDAVLRSVAVAEKCQGQGIGQALVAKALHHANRAGIERVFLLTETAVGFFPRFGFATIARADVPHGVQQSVEFTSACPASATVMVANLAQSARFNQAE